ncbi:hypothetical protein BCR33DRAFT_208035 [Rhizoclosmatium globosum]|uniref:SH3 domain-containing protein n=1 Tax=Rhizoclosmatium globosum TaxID=329046 RepID=A0A1Y2CCF9_9FUNG|nr:hypothetical protein BCR33DRAFT_208035 [Rhizoclosmatium globosum]|eukprot:ORY44741.1 hypothetical protein BCR33DRAFT_208035 [Rhizoclosmatium globosum]
MSLIKSVLFVQDGHAAKDPAVIAEAGNIVKGHIYVGLANAVRNLKVSLAVKGEWNCTWKPKIPKLDPETGDTVTPIMEGNLEATKIVCSVSQGIYEGTLLRGEHGMPGSIAIPVSAPPTLVTPIKTGNDHLQVPVPMRASCTYKLIITASCISVENGSEEKVFEMPLTVMAPSGLRAAVLRNQPRPLNFSNAARLSVPASVLLDAARISPFSYPRYDPLDPILRTLTPPVDVRPVFDNDTVLYELDMPRLHHYIGDSIPFTMAIKPKPPLSVDTKVHSVSASLITHIHFHIPPTVPDHQHPPSSAIAVRLHTETFDWDAASNPDDTYADATPQPRRFYFSIPDTIPCPSVPDTPQNKLPIEIIHMLRISVRLANLHNTAAELRSAQPISAVRVSNLDTAVIDIPIVLVSKGTNIHTWGIPRVPRGWRVGQAVAAIVESGDRETVVKGVAPVYESGTSSTSSTLAAALTSANITESFSPLQKRASAFFNSALTMLGKPGPASKHPKYTAEELKKMAEDAMKAGTEDVDVMAMNAAVSEDVPMSAGKRKLQASASSSSLDVRAVVSKVEDPVLSQEDDEEEMMEEEDPACASPATMEQPRGTKPTGFSHPSRIDSMQEDFAIDSRRFEQVGNREDQMEKELEHGIDEMGRFLPLDDFAGTYKVIYPYLEKLKDDEIKLSKGDIVEVSVSYVDGWAKGHNLTTREKGFVPLHCLCPELNATIEEGRILGKWFNRSLPS